MEILGRRPAHRDLTLNPTRMLLWWGPGLILLVVTGNTTGLIRPVAWTVGLFWMATLCFWNLARCGRVHCVFTGTFFLAMAALAGMAGAKLIAFAARGWSMLGLAILVGAIFLWRVPEMIWGRYWNRRNPL